MKEVAPKPASCAIAMLACQLVLFVVACSSDDSGAVKQLVDGSVLDSASLAVDATGGDVGAGPLDAGGVDGSINDGSTTDVFALPQNTGPTGPPPAGQLLLTASGEVLALSGYNFPAMNPGDSVFADGWEVRFDHVLATFGKVSLWTNPDMVPTNQSQHGPLVAELDGPWAVDLTQNGPRFPYIDGKEQGERAVAFAVLANENKNGNQPFPTNGDRLAVGFSAVVATPNALNVNLGPDGLSHYKEMVGKGCVVLYVGQAQWKGDQALCNGSPATDAGTDSGFNGSTGTEAEFARIPKVVNFDLCFKPRTALGPGAVETSWVNCDNQDNDPAMPLNGEPHQRGIAFTSNTYSVGEVTFHTDHPFWESTKHDTPARFDQFAAQVTGGDGGIPTVHVEDVMGVDYTAFDDKQRNALPWRTCDPNYQNPNGGSRVGQMHFDPVAVPHCTNGDSANGLCDYYDFSKYNQSTQGHWNGADGLCFVLRSYPSPP